MVLDAFPIYGVLKTLVGWLPNFYLKWRYPATRLAGLIYLDVQPRCEAVHLDLGKEATLRLALQIINLSPVAVEIDRASLKFQYAGGGASLDSLKREKLASGQIGMIYLEGQIADGHDNHMARNWQGNPAWLSGTVEFNCAVRHFGKSVNLMGLQVTQVNLDWRRKQLESAVQPASQA